MMRRAKTGPRMLIFIAAGRHCGKKKSFIYQELWIKCFKLFKLFLCIFREVFAYVIIVNYTRCAFILYSKVKECSETIEDK